jgi:hypothetical protein
MQEEIIFAIKLMNQSYNSDILKIQNLQINEQILINMIKKIKCKKYVECFDNNSEISNNSTQQSPQIEESQTTRNSSIVSNFSFPRSLYDGQSNTNIEQNI